MLKRYAVIIGLTLCVAMPAVAADGDASGFFFPFFDWIVDALFWWKSIIEQLWTTVNEYINGTIATVLDFVASVIDNLFGWLGVSGKAITDSFGAVITTVINIPNDVIEWFKGQLVLTFAGILTEMDQRIPDNYTLPTTEIVLVVNQIKAFGYFIDYPIISAAVFGTLAVNGSLALSKIIWRSIPGLG